MANRSTHPRAVILVEGDSDRVALETLAERRGRSLVTEQISVISMGGATNAGHFLARFGPPGRDLRLAGLYDTAEEHAFRRGLSRAGLGDGLTPTQMEVLGFYMCVADLEDELIRALGAVTVEEVIEAEGELGSFRTFQNQPAQRGRPVEHQMRRFMGTRSGRKIHYARSLVEALDLTRVPMPLNGVLAHVLSPSGPTELHG